jgi:hypothetical protein
MRDKPRIVIQADCRRNQPGLLRALLIVAKVPVISIAANDTSQATKLNIASFPTLNFYHQRRETGAQRHLEAGEVD